MAASKRLMKKPEEIRKCGVKNFLNIEEVNLLTCQGLAVPNNPPSGKGNFLIKINFSAEYPFKPHSKKKITFKRKIYHPNIDEKGQICLPVISSENWKPVTKPDQAIQSLIALVNDPFGLTYLKNILRTVYNSIRMLKSLHRNRGKAACGLKSAGLDSSECEQRSPSSAFRHPAKRDSVEN